jgi:hypothetical protein
MKALTELNWIIIELILLNLWVSKTGPLSDLLTSQELPSAGSEKNDTRRK